MFKSLITYISKEADYNSNKLEKIVDSIEKLSYIFIDLFKETGIAGAVIFFLFVIVCVLVILIVFGALYVIRIRRRDHQKEMERITKDRNFYRSKFLENIPSSTNNYPEESPSEILDGVDIEDDGEETK